MATLVPRRFRRKSMADLPASFEWMDRWMDRFFNEPVASRLVGGLLSVFGESSELMPAFDVTETGDHIIVKGDLPGIDSKNLEINLSGNILIVRGEKQEEHKEENESFHWMERQFGSFTRSFTLPADVKQDGIEATYKDGVLIISIPKAETAVQKKIEVKTQ